MKTDGIMIVRKDGAVMIFLNLPPDDVEAAIELMAEGVASEMADDVKSFHMLRSKDPSTYDLIKEAVNGKDCV